MKHVSRSIPSLLIQGQLVSGLFSYRLRLCPALDEGGNYFSLCLIRSFYCCETDNEVDDRLPYRETLLSLLFLFAFAPRSSDLNYAYVEQIGREAMRCE